MEEGSKKILHGPVADYEPYVLVFYKNGIFRSFLAITPFLGLNRDLRFLSVI